MSDLAILSRTAACDALSLQLRESMPSDAAGLHELLTTTLPDTLQERQRWEARWEWACWKNPFRGDRPAGWVLAKDDRILGHIGAVYVPLRIGGKRVLGAIASDYAIAPDTATRERAFPALDLAQAFFDAAGQTNCAPLATTANEKTAAVFARFGCKPVPWTREFFRMPADLPHEIRACRGGENRLIRRLQTGRFAAPLSRITTSLYARVGLRPRLPIPRGCSLDQTSDVAKWAAVLGKLDGTYNLPGPEIERSAEYLTWRYADHPEREHVRLLMVGRTKDEPIGAAIVFIDDRPDRCVAVVEDVIVPAGSPGIIKVLLCAALRFACDQGVNHLVTNAGRLDCRSIYWELGFTSRARSAPAVLLPKHLVPTAGAVGRDVAPDLGDTLELWHGSMF